MFNNSTSMAEMFEIDSFYFYKTEQFIFLCILFLSIVIGNLSVLIALHFNKNHKSRMKFFIRQLAIADLSVGMINVLTDIIWHITVAWYAGNILCKVIKFFQVLVTYSSTYVLVALSVDRYDAIRHPMNFSSSWSRARCLIGAAWLISFIFATPMLLFYEEKLVQGQTQCWIEFGSQWQWQLYMTLVAISLFIIPAVVITTCYTVIVITIWSNNKMVTIEPQHILEELDIRRASSRGLIPRAKIKTVKMTFVIVFVFIICWSPYIIFDLLQVYGCIPKTQNNIALATFIQSLAPLNSAANPIIYCVFSTRICSKKNVCCLRNSNRNVVVSDVARWRTGKSNTRSTSMMSEILTANPRKDHI